MTRNHRRALVLGAAIVVLIAVGATAAWLGRPPQATPGDRVPVSITIVPFGIEGSPPPGWSAVAFVKTLAARLRIERGLAATVDTGAATHAPYTLEGKVIAQGPRIVIGIRLRRSAREPPVWTATFWRRDVTDPALPGDLARTVAEALDVVERGRNAAGPGRR